MTTIITHLSPLVAASGISVMLLLRATSTTGAEAKPAPTPAAIAPCRVEVVERGSGWPVPMVQLRTTHHQVYVSDNAGLIALDAPELMGREVWFDVVGHGYEIPKDGFGYRGVRLHPEPGGVQRVEVRRTIVARRLGRATGAGLFAESQRLGAELDWRDPAEGNVFGCDSVQNAVYRGRLFWAWGDTSVPRYPLGVFDMTSATTAIQPLSSFEPPLRLHFDYFTDTNGRPRGVARMAGAGPTWVSGYVALPDSAGAPHLVGSFIKVRNHLEAYEAGLCVWNEERAEFVIERKLWTKTDAAQRQPAMPEGHPAFWRDDAGVEWVLFGNPFPTLRCRATFESWRDPSQWTTVDPPRTLRSSTNAVVKPHSGSMAWSDYRKRWITVFMEAGGKPSGLGELWYAEAVSPFGPWGRAVKVVSHENYTFYNPRLHPEFTPANSPILIFEGTYTQEFANHPAPTPRYDYNQIVYRLDLDDPALAPARSKP